MKDKYLCVTLNEGGGVFEISIHNTVTEAERAAAASVLKCCDLQGSRVDSAVLAWILSAAREGDAPTVLELWQGIDPKDRGFAVSVQAADAVDRALLPFLLPVLAKSITQTKLDGKIVLPKKIRRRKRARGTSVTPLNADIFDVILLSLKVSEETIQQLEFGDEPSHTDFHLLEGSPLAAFLYSLEGRMVANKARRPLHWYLRKACEIEADDERNMAVRQTLDFFHIPYRIEEEPHGSK